MEITELEIVNAITEMFDRINNLEDEQDKSKEFINSIKQRLLELNSCVDDILDIISDDVEIAHAEKLKNYSKMKIILLKELEQQENKFNNDMGNQLMNQIVGES